MLNVGDIVLAKVTGISDFGFFVSVGEYSGLCHISEVSNDFVDDIEKSCPCKLPIAIKYFFNFVSLKIQAKGKTEFARKNILKLKIEHIVCNIFKVLTIKSIHILY